MSEGMPKSHEVPVEEDRSFIDLAAGTLVKSESPAVEAQSVQENPENRVPVESTEYKETAAAPRMVAPEAVSIVETPEIRHAAINEVKERLGINKEKNEQAAFLEKQLESLDATNKNSSERLRTIFDKVEGNPELFGGDSERAKEFRERVAMKAKELTSGPVLMEKKEKFWEKWKLGSVMAGGASAVAVAGGAAWTAYSGFDHTYMVEVLGNSMSGPIMAGFLASVLSLGSMGVAKVMETLRDKKGDLLKRNLRTNHI